MHSAHSQLRYLHLTDLSPFQLEDFKFQIRVPKLLSHFRHPAEKPEHEPAESIEVRGLEVRSEQLIHLVER